MEPIVCGFAALSVAAVFYSHRALLALRFHRERKLRERVTFMLWVMAKSVH